MECKEVVPQFSPHTINNNNNISHVDYAYEDSDDECRVRHIGLYIIRSVIIACEEKISFDKNEAKNYFDDLKKSY